MENVIIAGSGPAGMTAAIYTARANLNPLVMEGPTPGGQLVVSSDVENFPGFPEAISGMELMDRHKKQAERFGARFVMEAVEKAGQKEDFFEVTSSSGTNQTQALVIATGAEARRLPIPTEPKFYGKGVSGCATCDGAFYREKEVLVVGGGNSAMEDAVFLTRFAKKVTIVHRRHYLRASAVEVERARKNPKIHWMIPWVVEEIRGGDFVTGALLKNRETGETKEVKCDGIFVAIGHEPKTSMFSDLVELDKKGFIKIEPGTPKTSIPGVFACGDACDPFYKQAVLAAGYGCMAAMEVERYLGLKE